MVTLHWWTSQWWSLYTDELAISDHPTLTNWPSVVSLHWWTGQRWSPYTDEHEACEKGTNKSAEVNVHQFGSVVKHQAGKKMDVDSSQLPLTFLFSNCGLWTLSCNFAQNNNNKTLNWLLLMPVWLQNHFCNDSVVLAINCDIDCRIFSGCHLFACVYT